MKRITVVGYLKGTDIGHTDPLLCTMELEGPEKMDASDGYHFFSELYDHRIALYIALCVTIDIINRYLDPKNDPKMEVAVLPIWRSKLHADGTSLEGWFVLGIGKEKGKQMTYHLPLNRWDEVSFAETLERGPEWDGHTSADVLERLKGL